MQPIIFQDDSGKFSSNRMDAQAGNDKIEACVESKLLNLHKDKSCYILIGDRKTTQSILEELEACPLTLYGEKMKKKDYEKYLGDYIHHGGVSVSVEKTVNERCGKLTNAIKEIRAIVEDCRSTSLGGLKVGLDIWESAYIPSLMSNSSTWMEIKDSIEKLEEVQNSLYRNLLNVPHTTPKASLIWEVGGLKMKYRIMMKKLIFMNHILHLGENTLAKQIQMSQELNNSPGLTSEVKDFIAKLGLPNCFKEIIPKNKWKYIVKKSIEEAN